MRRITGIELLVAGAALAAALAVLPALAQTGMLGRPLDPPAVDAVTWALRVLFTALVAVVVPVYSVKFGPTNFLWFSDIGLFGICAALWLGLPLLGSMMALAVLLPETLWIASFVTGAIARGRGISTLATYMFDPSIPLYLRVISCTFHFALPPGALWLVYRFGYDERALAAQTLLAWIVLPATLWLAPPEKNVNWVHGFGHPPRTLVPARWHFAFMMLVFPLAVYWPTHLLLAALLGEA